MPNRVARQRQGKAIDNVVRVDLEKKIAGLEFNEHYVGIRDHLGLIQTCMDPENFDPQRLPDPLSAGTSVFKAPTVRNFSGPLDGAHGSWNHATGRTNGTVAAGGSGETTIIVSPGVKGNILLSAGAEIDKGAAFGTLHMNPIHMAQQPTGARFLNNGLWDETSGVALVPRKCNKSLLATSISNPVVYEFYSSSTLGFPLSVIPQVTPGASHEDLFSNGVLYYWRFEQTVAAPYGPGAWSARQTATFAVAAAGLPAHWLCSYPVGPTAVGGWAFEWAPVAYGVPEDFSFSLHFTDTNVDELVFIQNSACTYLVEDSADLGALVDTQMFRTTALSGLLSYHGSDLANGGSIAAARITPGQAIQDAPNGDVYGYLSQLPKYRYDGALRKGAYGWWLGQTGPEYDMRRYPDNHDSDSEATRLVFSMSRDDIDQSLRLQVYQHIETLNSSNTYPDEVMFPTSAWPTLQNIGNQLPACTSNDGHKGFFGRAWARIKQIASDPNTYLKLLKEGAKFVTGLKMP